MKCVDCKEEILEEEATTYLQIDKWGMFEDYASVLCKNCLDKRHVKIGIVKT